MSKSADELYIETLSRREARLAEEFARLNDQLDRTVDEALKIRIERQIEANEEEQKKIEAKIAARRQCMTGERPQQSDSLLVHSQAPYAELAEKIAELSRATNLADVLAEMEVLRRQIEGSKRTGGSRAAASQRDLYLDEVMHEIDYTEVQEFLETEERRHADDGFAALCLIQNSSALGGEWCLNRIKGWLHKKKGSTPNEVIISPSEGEGMDATFVLRRLAAKFAGEHPEHDLATYAQSIIQKICGSIHLGGHLLIVLRQWEDFTDQESTLCWLLKEFWRPLVSAFRQSENRTRAKLLLVVMTDLEIEIQDAADLCCGPADFDCEKIVRLQLRHWHRDELRDWIIDHWGRWLTLNEIQPDELTDKIYAASRNGDPDQVYKQAKKRLVKEAV